MLSIRNPPDNFASMHLFISPPSCANMRTQILGHSGVRRPFNSGVASYRGAELCTHGSHPAAALHWDRIYSAGPGPDPAAAQGHKTKPYNVALLHRALLLRIPCGAFLSAGVAQDFERPQRADQSSRFPQQCCCCFRCELGQPYNCAVFNFPDVGKPDH